MAVLSAIVAWLWIPNAATPQDRPPAPLRVFGLQGGGVRATTTESWIKLDFGIANTTGIGRRARVLAFYRNQPEVQYGRDLWVPPRAIVNSWMPLGPAPQQEHTSSRDLQLVLYDRTHGTETLVLPASEERIREFGLIYRKREATTVLITDDGQDDDPVAGQLPRPESAADEALTLARVARAVRGQSMQVQFAGPGALPGWAKLFDGVDQLIIASNRVAEHPVGMRALRHWLEQGGTVWAMLDLIDPDAVAALLGETLDFHLVGRVGLIDFRVDEGSAPGERQHHEHPVTLARIVLPPGEAANNTVDGWPVWFTRNVGRGKVLFTTLGPRAWHRPRTARDGNSPYDNFPYFPVGRDTVSLINEASHGARTEAYPEEAFHSVLTRAIGYNIIGGDVVAGVFALCLGGTLALSVLARRRGRVQLAGWLGPIGAVAAAAVLFTLGQASRHAAPPAVAFAQSVHVVDGTNEAAVTGLLALYRPDSGTIDLGARDGGFCDLEMTGLEGQTRRLIMTDMDSWHWEHLALPAGVRFAPMRFTAPSTEPIAAVAHFGAAGLEGKLTTGAFRNAADALLTSGRARNLALRLQPDGTFTAGPDDALPPRNFVAGALLSDRQQQRQDIYRRMLKPEAAPRQERPLLLAWTDAADTPLVVPAETQVSGTALLGIPLRLERSGPGKLVTIPGMFVPVRRVLGDRTAWVAYESSQPAQLDLRFQLPSVVLPLRPESARFILKINARGRRIAVASPTDGGTFVEHAHVDNPLVPMRVNLAEPRWLQPDAQGGIHLRLTIGDARRAADGPNASADADRVWSIEYMELEVTGRTAAP